MYEHENNLICKTAAQFRKKFPEYPEHSEQIGKRSVPVFIDGTEFLEKCDLPDDVKNCVLEKVNDECTRFNGCCFAIYKVSEISGDGYWVDVEHQTYNVYNAETDKLLYSVLYVTGWRYNVYRADKYGSFGLPVGNGTYNWKTLVNTYIKDLYYRGNKIQG